MADAVLYWLFDEDCMDPWSQGYVGVTQNYAVRMKNHQKKFKRFKHLVLFEGSVEECYRSEKLMRSQPGIGWNISRGGTWEGYTSEVVKLGLSKSSKKKQMREKIGLSKRGNQNSLGKKLSDEQKKKISESRTGQPSAMKGRTHSEESKQKIRTKRALQTISDETRAKMQKSQLERWARIRGG